MRVKQFLFSWFLLTAMCLSASAYDFEVDGIYYSKTSENTVEVTKDGPLWAAPPYEGDVVIPKSIEVDGQVYTVIGIGDRAFSGSGKNVTSVSLPNTIRRIGYESFGGISLTSLFLPESLEEIGIRAFSSSHLMSVSLPEGLQTIGDEAFNGTCIATVVIPASVTSIGIAAFGHCQSFLDKAGCHGLASVSVAEGNPVYDSRNNCNAIIETATNTVIQGSLSMVLPEDVLGIAERAFYHLMDLEILYLPASVETCGYACLYGCNGLKDIYVANPTPPATVRTLAAGSYHMPYSTATLHVPIGSKDRYLAADCWMNFSKIEEFDPSTFDNPTVLEGIVTDNPIHNHAAVYDLQGREIKPHPCPPQKGRENSLSEGSKPNLPKGMYIVNGKKVVIK